MMQGMQRMMRLLAVASVSLVAACGTSVPVDVSGLDRAIGDELPGARGQTIEDQDRIDDTVARGCATGIFTRPACDRHSVVSADRRRVLAAAGKTPTT